MVITLAAVLSAVALPKLTGMGESAKARAISEARFAVAAAQKAAQAARRPIFVEVGQDVSFCWTSPCSSGGVPMRTSGGDNTVKGGSDAPFSATEASFSFDARGIPSTTEPNEISSGGFSFIVEPFTGATRTGG